MPESIQRLFFRHKSVFDAVKSTCELLKKTSDALMYLASPEDTTQSTGERKSLIKKYSKLNIFGTLKAVAWIAVSITLALLLGTLN